MSGIMSDDRVAPEGYNLGTTKRYADRSAYGYPCHNTAYERMKSGDPYTIWNIIRRQCIAMFQFKIPARYYRVVYNSGKDMDEAEHNRAILMKSARSHDKNYPFDIWMTLSVIKGEKDVQVRFYTTVESLLANQLYGKCIMDCTTAGLTRIVRSDSVTRIYYLSPSGVAEYYKMKFNPISEDLNTQNKHMYTQLIAVKGLAFNPGKRFLKYQDPSYSLTQNGIIKNYNYTGFNERRFKK